MVYTLSKYRVYSGFRGMNSKTRAVTVRLTHDIADYIDEQENRSRYVREALEGYRKIEMICMWGEISTEEFCQQISDLFLSGKISVEEGKLIFS